MAQWICAIFEETLWAKYQFAKGFPEVDDKKQKVTQASQVSYLFEVKEVLEPFHIDQSPLLALHTLTKSWFQTNGEQKQKIIQQLKQQNIKEDSHGLMKSVPKKFDKVLKLAHTFSETSRLSMFQNFKEFYSNSRYSLKQREQGIKESELAEIIKMSLKIQQTKNEKKEYKKAKRRANGQTMSDFDVNTQNPRYQEALEFIVNLYQSSLDRIHQGKDIICRLLLKLIQQMHQEQVIHELLNTDEAATEEEEKTQATHQNVPEAASKQSAQGKNKKKKKKGKINSQREGLKQSDQNSQATQNNAMKEPDQNLATVLEQTPEPVQDSSSSKSKPSPQVTCPVDEWKVVVQPTKHKIVGDDKPLDKEEQKSGPQQNNKIIKMKSHQTQPRDLSSQIYNAQDSQGLQKACAQTLMNSYSNDKGSQQKSIRNKGSANAKGLEKQFSEEAEFDPSLTQTCRAKLLKKKKKRLASIEQRASAKLHTFDSRSEKSEGAEAPEGVASGEESATSSQKVLIEEEMNLISNEYISEMLLKIEHEFKSSNNEDDQLPDTSSHPKPQLETMNPEVEKPSSSKKKKKGNRQQKQDKLEDAHPAQKAVSQVVTSEPLNPPTESQPEEPHQKQGNHKRHRKNKHKDQNQVENAQNPAIDNSEEVKCVREQQTQKATSMVINSAPPKTVQEEGGQKAGGRRRRKKNQNDPQAKLNEFIMGLTMKKDDQIKTKPKTKDISAHTSHVNSRIVSRRTSPSQKTGKKQAYTQKKNQISVEEGGDQKIIFNEPPGMKKEDEPWHESNNQKDKKKGDGAVHQLQRPSDEVTQPLQYQKKRGTMTKEHSKERDQLNQPGKGKKGGLGQKKMSYVPVSSKKNQSLRASIVEERHEHSPDKTSSPFEHKKQKAKNPPQEANNRPISLNTQNEIIKAIEASNNALQRKGNQSSIPKKKDGYSKTLQNSPQMKNRRLEEDKIISDNSQEREQAKKEGPQDSLMMKKSASVMVSPNEFKPKNSAFQNSQGQKLDFGGGASNKNYGQSFGGFFNQPTFNDPSNEFNTEIQNLGLSQPPIMPHSISHPPKQSKQFFRGHQNYDINGQRQQRYPNMQGFGSDDGSHYSFNSSQQYMMEDMASQNRMIHFNQAGNPGGVRFSNQHDLQQQLTQGLAQILQNQAASQSLSLNVQNFEVPREEVEDDEESDQSEEVKQANNSCPFPVKQNQLHTQTQVSQIELGPKSTLQENLNECNSSGVQRGDNSPESEEEEAEEEDDSSGHCHPGQGQGQGEQGRQAIYHQRGHSPIVQPQTSAPYGQQWPSPHQYPDQMSQQYQPPAGNFWMYNNYQQFHHGVVPQQQFMQMPMQYPGQQMAFQHPDHFIEQKFYEKLDQDIYDEVNRIQRSLDLTKEDRNFIKNRLQTMCEEIFNEEQKDPSKEKKNHPKIQQFGSLITGLALETSDMDVAVTNLFLPSREDMIKSLELLAEELKKWKVIKNLNAIPTAAIPVIKAEVDLNLLRETEQLTAGFKTKDQKRDFLKPELPEELQMLKIDITFDDNSYGSDQDKNDLILLAGGFQMPHQQQPIEHISQPTSSIIFGGETSGLQQRSHQGLASCKLIKYYVETYKCLKEVSIVLKQLLAQLGLNQPYLGGLSSYSTVLLVVAFMNKFNFKQNPALTPARLLMSFLDYYSYYFNVQHFGIDVTRGGAFFEHTSSESNFVIMDPINDQGNNTSKSCYQTHEIIQSFRKTFSLLKQLRMDYQQMRNSNIQQNLLDVILLKNQDYVE